MPIPILLGALAALGVGGALGAAQGLGQRKHEEDNIMRKVMTDASMSGVKLPPDVISKYFSKDAVPAFNMLAEARQASQQQALTAFQGFGGPSSGGGQANLTQPPPASEMVPGDSAAPEWALPGPAEPQTPSVAAFMPQSVRPSPGGSMSLEAPGGLKMTKTVPGTSEAESARVGMEADRLRAEQAKRPGELTLQQQAITEGTQKIAKSGTEAARSQREDVARVEAADLISKAAKSTDPREQLELLTLAHAAAVKGALHQTEGIVSQINHIRDKISGKTLDLKDPNTAEFISTTGKNPHTQELVSPQIKREADAFVKAQTQRKLTQANTIAQGLAGVQTKALTERVAISGAIKTLVKEGDNVAKAKVASDQIEEALKHIEKNIDVFPGTAIVGTPSAYLAKLFQTDRGQRAKTIQTSLNVLQSLEARRIAGEQGRIANQIEQQWRDTLGSTTTTSQATMRKLITRSRELKNAMIQGNTTIIRRNAGAARGVGVPSQIVDAFTKGDIDVLKSTLGEGLTGGTLPAVIDMGDLDMSKMELVK